MKKLLNHLALTLISSLALLSLCLTSCKSFLNDNQTDDVNVTYITFTDSARTASVVKPDLIDYTVTAHKTDKNGTKLTGNDAKSVSVYEPFGEVTLTYKLALESGWWVFEASGYEHKDNVPEDEKGNPIRTNPILYGNTTKPVYCNGGRYYETIRVDFMKTGKGKVNLEIDVSKVTINRLIISGTGTALDAEYRDPNKSGKIIIEKENLVSGIYNAKMDFYSDLALLYTTTETINITDNLEVKNWFYSGGKDYLVLRKNLDPDTQENTNTLFIADFVLTPDLIIQHKNTYCYVGKVNDVALKSLKAPSDSNSGSVIAPYATLEAAFDRTKALNIEFKKAGKPQQDFIIYIAEDINASTTGEAAISSTSDYPLNLSIQKYEATESEPTITGNISIGTNVSTSISQLKLNGLKSSSKLTLNSCKLSGSADFEINNVSTESVITNTAIGTSTVSSKISFNNSNVKIVNTKNDSLYASDFTADNSTLNFTCSSNSTSDRFLIKANNFKIINSNGTAENKIAINSATINTNNNFVLEDSSYIKLTNLTLNVSQFNTSNLLNTEITGSTNISATSGTNLSNSQIDFTNTRLAGVLHISGNTSGTGSQRKVTFSGSNSIVSGNGITVSNSDVEFKNSSSITSSGSISFENSALSFNSGAKINNKLTPVSIENCNTLVNDASINAKSVTFGNTSTSGSTKPDTVTINNDSTITTNDGITFNSSKVNISESTVYGSLFVLNDDLIFNDSTLYGDIGRADTSASGTGSAADGIDTASKVILSGTSKLCSYTVGDTKYSGTAYIEDTAILYTKNLPSKEDSPATIAILSALYPTKDEVILVLLDSDDEEINFDNTFIVGQATGSTPIDERFKLSSAGYYLDYLVPANDTVRKGVIKESSVSLILPNTGGFTIDIAENNNITINAQGHIVINKNNLAQAPVKAIIKNSSGNVINTEITYRLYREATQIGSDVTSSANSQGIVISGQRLDQELQYVDKITYLLQIMFTDPVTDLLYADTFFVDIVN